MNQFSTNVENQFIQVVDKEDQKTSTNFDKPLQRPLNKRIETLPKKQLFIQPKTSNSLNENAYQLQLGQQSQEKEDCRIRKYGESGGTNINANNQNSSNFNAMDINESSLSNQQSMFSGSQSVSNIFKQNQIGSNNNNQTLENNSSNIMSNLSQILAKPQNQLINIADDSKLNNISNIIASFPNQNNQFQITSSNQIFNDQTLGDQLNDFSFETQQFPNMMVGNERINEQIHFHNEQRINQSISSPSKNLFQTNKAQTINTTNNNGSFISPLQNKSQQNIINYSGFNTNMNEQQHSQDLIAITNNLSPIGQQNVINLKSPSNNLNGIMQFNQDKNHPSNGWQKIQVGQFAKKHNTLISTFSLLPNQTSTTKTLHTNSSQPSIIISRQHFLKANINQNGTQQNNKLQSTEKKVLKNTEQKQSKKSGSAHQISGKTLRRRDKSQTSSKNNQIVVGQSSLNNVNGSQTQNIHSTLERKNSKRQTSKRRRVDSVDNDAKIILETTQDIERLELEMLNEASQRNNELEQMEQSFEQEKIHQISQAECILQESRRDASSRERFFTQREFSQENTFNNKFIGGTQVMTEQKNQEFSNNLTRGISINEEHKIQTERAALNFHAFNFNKQSQLTLQNDTMESNSNANSDSHLNFKSNGLIKQCSLKKVSLQQNPNQNLKISTQKIKISKIKGKKLSFNSVTHQTNGSYSNLQIQQTQNNANTLDIIEGGVNSQNNLITKNTLDNKNFNAAPASGQATSKMNNSVRQALNHKNKSSQQYICGSVKISLLKLLLSEFQRKKKIDLKQITNIVQQISLLLQFWEESLSSEKIIRKLEFKENNLKTKLSDKEIKLKQFLTGENQDLLDLQEDSTTRKYGELAVIKREELKVSFEIFFSDAKYQNTQNLEQQPTQ
eukprot:403375893